MGAAQGQMYQAQRRVYQDPDDPIAKSEPSGRASRRSDPATAATRSTDTLGSNRARGIRAAIPAAAARHRRRHPQTFPARQRCGAPPLVLCAKPSFEKSCRCGLHGQQLLLPSLTAATIWPTSNSVWLRFDASTAAFIHSWAPSAKRRRACIAGSASWRCPCARNPKPAWLRPRAVRRCQLGSRRCIRVVEEPGDRGEIAARSAQFSP